VDEDALNSYLDGVLISGRERRQVVIADYDPAWPHRFALERDRIHAALGSVAIRIEHIGSTSVPGLAAKPIVDVLVTVADPEADELFGGALKAASYELRVRELGHRMFRTPARDIQVHVWADEDREIDRYLRFRDRLRDSPERRREYERLKRELAQRDWPDINHYANAKGPFIESVLAAERRGGPE
jgi:GrpB-like predicted nucleotidyltransferase (UPF0157 family)